MPVLRGGELDLILLRQALALSLLREKPLTVEGGDELIARFPAAPGLLADWTAALDQAGMGRLRHGEGPIVFEPCRPARGNFDLAAGNDGSVVETALLLMPALFFRPCRSRLAVRGVTHRAPFLSTDEVRETLLGLLESMGFYAALSLKRFGFAGSGGGLIEVKIYPAEAKKADPFAPGPRPPAGARVYVSRLPTALAMEQKEYLERELRLGEGSVGVMEVLAADGPGNIAQTYLGRVPALRVLSAVMDQPAGERTFAAGEDPYAAMKELVRETRVMAQEGAVPFRIAREALPYCVLSGSESGSMARHGAFGAHLRVYDAIL